MLLRPGLQAAFSVKFGRERRVRAGQDLPAQLDAVRQDLLGGLETAVVAQHGVEPAGIFLQMAQALPIQPRTRVASSSS